MSRTFCDSLYRDADANVEKRLGYTRSNVSESGCDIVLCQNLGMGFFDVGYSLCRAVNQQLQRPGLESRVKRFFLSGCLIREQTEYRVLKSNIQE
jgi:hypothetical protein